MSVFMFGRNDKPTTMRRPAVMKKTKDAVKKPVEAPPHAEKRASSAAGMVEPTPTYVTVSLPPPILEEVVNHNEEKPTFELQTPWGEAIRVQTPWGEAIRAPPPKPPRHVEIESIIYAPRLLEGRAEHGGAVALPNAESVIYAPQHAPPVLEGLLIAEGGEAREESRRRRPLYT